MYFPDVAHPWKSYHHRFLLQSLLSYTGSALLMGQMACCLLYHSSTANTSTHSCPLSSPHQISFHVLTVEDVLSYQRTWHFEKAFGFHHMHIIIDICPLENFPISTGPPYCNATHSGTRYQFLLLSWFNTTRVTCFSTVFKKLYLALKRLYLIGSC